MKIRPLHDRVLVRRIEGEEKTSGPAQRRFNALVMCVPAVEAASRNPVEGWDLAPRRPRGHVDDRFLHSQECGSFAQSGPGSGSTSGFGARAWSTVAASWADVKGLERWTKSSSPPSEPRR